MSEIQSNMEQKKSNLNKKGFVIKKKTVEDKKTNECFKGKSVTCGKQVHTYLVLIE